MSGENDQRFSIGRLLTTKELADILRTTARTLERYIDRGDLKAAWVGRGYKIQEDEVKRFLAERTGKRPARKISNQIKKSAKHEGQKY